MPLLIAIVLRIVSNPVTNVFQKKLTEYGIPPFRINFITFFILGLFCLLPAGEINWEKYPVVFWWNVLLAGIFGTAGNGLLVLALEKGELSVLGPINSYKSVFGLVLGAIVLHEIPGIYDITGIVLIIIGSYFVLETTRDRLSTPIWRNRAVGYRFGAMFLTAVEAIFIKKVILYSTPMVAFYFWCWLGALFSCLFPLLFRLTSRTKVKKESPISRRNQWQTELYFYTGLVLCIGIMQYTTNYIFERMNVGCALALFQISTIISVFFGIRFFHEKHFLHKMAGALVMIAGSFMILLFK